MLNGNYLINFNNCSVRIKDYYFFFFLEITKERQIIENTNKTQNFKHKISFEQIEKEHQYNVRNIGKLKYHTKITYGSKWKASAAYPLKAPWQEYSFYHKAQSV